MIGAARSNRTACGIFLGNIESSQRSTIDDDLRLSVVNEHICVGEKYGLGHRHLPHPLTCLPPHFLPGPPQNLGGTPE